MSTNTEQNFISTLQPDTGQSTNAGRMIVQSQFQLNLSSSAVRIDHDDDNSLTIGANGGSDPNLVIRSDYDKAILFGSTYLRLGTAILGERNI